MIGLMRKIIAFNGSLISYQLSRGVTALLEGQYAFVPFWAWGHGGAAFEEGKQRLEARGFRVDFIPDYIRFRRLAFAFANQFHDEVLHRLLDAMKGQIAITDTNVALVRSAIGRIVAISRGNHVHLKTDRWPIYDAIEDIWHLVSHDEPIDRFFSVDHHAASHPSPAVNFQTAAPDSMRESVPAPAPVPVSVPDLPPHSVAVSVIVVNVAPGFLPVPVSVSDSVSGSNSAAHSASDRVSTQNSLVLVGTELDAQIKLQRLQVKLDDIEPLMKKKRCRRFRCLIL